jgi:hypothetical protein
VRAPRRHASRYDFSVPTRPDRVSALRDKVIAGDVLAWKELFLELVPVVERLVAASAKMGSLRRSEDDRRSVVTSVFERLRRDDFRALRLYRGWQERYPERGFDDWLSAVTTNVIRDHVGARLGPAASDGAKRLVNTLAERLEPAEAGGVRPPLTDVRAAHELMELAERLLTPEQLRGLRRWLEGEELGEEERKRARAAVARLRRFVAE